MRGGMGVVSRCVAVMAGVWCVVALCGCSQGQVADPDWTGERMASSFGAYAQVLLDRDGEVLDPVQYGVLERAVDSGEISAGDYAAAWSDYAACVVQKGYPRPEFYMLENGLYQSSGITAPDEYAGDIAYGERLLDASRSCKDAHISAIQEFYQAQTGNPNLYANKAEGSVDCLKRAGLVPMSYTLAEYEVDRSAWDHGRPDSKPVIDLDSAEVRGCLAANDYVFMEPWGQ